MLRLHPLQFMSCRFSLWCLGDPQNRFNEKIMIQRQENSVITVISLYKFHFIGNLRNNGFFSWLHRFQHFRNSSSKIFLIFFLNVLLTDEQILIFFFWIYIFRCLSLSFSLFLSNSHVIGYAEKRQVTCDTKHQRVAPFTPTSNILSDSKLTFTWKITE